MLDLTTEYTKILAFRRFKRSVIDHFVSFIETRLRFHKKQLRQANQRQCQQHTTQRFIDTIFTKWWFYTALHNGIDRFLPKDTLHVQTSDIAYHIRSYGVKPVKDDIEYGADTIRSLCDRYRQEALDDKYPTAKVGSSLDKGQIRIVALDEPCKILETLQVSPIQETHLRRRFKGSAEHFTDYVAVETLRLTALGAISEHLSMPPILLERLGIDVECFGTPLNTSLDNFCGPFPDIETLFGSCGNFMEFQFESGKRYTFNPPYDPDLMTETTRKMLTMLRETPNVCVFALFPIWDPETQRRMGLKDYGEPFPAFDLIKQSGFVHHAVAVKKEEFPYYNYFTDRYVTAANTHIILLSNTETLPEGWTMEQIERDWPRS